MYSPQYGSWVCLKTGESPNMASACNCNGGSMMRVHQILGSLFSDKPSCFLFPGWHAESALAETAWEPGHWSDLHKLHGWQLQCQYWLKGNQHQSASQPLGGSKRIISIDKSKRHVAKKKPLPQGTAQVIKGPPPREGMLKRTEWQGQCEEQGHHI